MSVKTAGRTRLSVRYFDDRIVLTETHAWAYFRVPTVSYEFTTPAERETLAAGITVALAAIRMADAEVHLRIAHRPYPAAEWATTLDATSDGGAGWHSYLDEMYRHVWAKDFWTKEVYLGVRLGQRGVRAQLSGGLLAQLTSTYRTAEQALGLIDEAVPAAEITRWTEQAGTRCTARSLSRCRRLRAAASGARVRSSRCSKARSTTGGRYCASLSRPANRGPRACRSHAFPTSCTSPKASRGFITPTRCRSRSRPACA
jgi:hypothetical protein